MGAIPSSGVFQLNPIKISDKEVLPMRYLRSALLVTSGFFLGYNAAVRQIRNEEPERCPPTVQERVGEASQLRYCMKELEAYGVKIRDTVDTVMDQYKPLVR